MESKAIESFDHKNAKHCASIICKRLLLSNRVNGNLHFCDEFCHEDQEMLEYRNSKKGKLALGYEMLKDGAKDEDLPSDVLALIVEKREKELAKYHKAMARKPFIPKDENYRFEFNK